LQISHRPHGKLTFCSLLAGRWCRSLWRHSDHLIVHHQWEHSWLGARSSSKVPIAQWETHVLLLVCRAAVSMFIVAQYQLSTPKCIPTKLPMCALVFKVPIAPMGRMLTRLPAQRLSLAQLRLTLWSTTVGTCRRDLKFSHCPNGKIADVLALTHFCTTAADAPVNYRLYVPQRPSMFPIAPMGDSRFARFLQGGGVYVYSGTVTISSCIISGNTASAVRAHVQNFPSPRWETHVCFCWLCRVVVSMSILAQ
jgi:hypothetical protein